MLDKKKVAGFKTEEINTDQQTCLTSVAQILFYARNSTRNAPENSPGRLHEQNMLLHNSSAVLAPTNHGHVLLQISNLHWVFAPLYQPKNIQLNQRHLLSQLSKIFQETFQKREINKQETVSMVICQCSPGVWQRPAQNLVPSVLLTMSKCSIQEIPDVCKWGLQKCLWQIFTSIVPEMNYFDGTISVFAPSLAHSLCSATLRILTGGSWPPDPPACILLSCMYQENYVDVPSFLAKYLARIPRHDYLIYTEYVMYND